MQYKVPQDVQREDTIIGPLTLKQMIILGAGGGLAYAIYVSLATTYYMEIWLPPVAIVVIITLAFAFLKIHNLPFYRFLMNFIEFHIMPKKRIWIQGTGTAFMSLLDRQKKEDAIQKEKIKNVETEENIEKLSKILDSHGDIKITK